MRGGLRRLVNPGTPAQEIDVDGTREARQALREQLRKRQVLLDELLAQADGSSHQAASLPLDGNGT